MTRRRHILMRRRRSRDGLEMAWRRHQWRTIQIWEKALADLDTLKRKQHAWYVATCSVIDALRR